MKLISYFERKVVNGKIVGELEGLRFLAILPVVLQHCIERWYRNAGDLHLSPLQEKIVTYFLGGSSGVYLFFAISGFILTLPFATRVSNNTPDPLGSLKKYFIRRLTRLEPPYIVVMLLMAIASWFLGKMTGIEVTKYFFAGITYTTNLIFHHHNPLNPVIWSLEVEIQFYIIAPFLAYLFFKIRNFHVRNAVIVAVMVAAIGMQDYTGIGHASSYLRSTILGQLQYFLIGILMVSLYMNRKLQPTKFTVLWSIAGVAAFLYKISFLWVEGFGKTLLFTAVLVVLFMAAFCSGAFNRFLKLPWIMAIGGMCYTIYLLHLAIAQGSMDLMLKFRNKLPNDYWWVGGYALLFVIFFLLTVPVFYILIEKPCMDHSWPGKLKRYISEKVMGKSKENEETSK